MRPSAAAGTLLLLATAACGGTSEAPAVEATIDTVAGIENVRYPEAGHDLAWTADTVAVLGDAFAEDAYQFNETSEEGLAGDDEGNLYLLDRQGRRVLRYDPDGRHLASYGGEGEGPGELMQPLGLAVSPDDTIWVTDFSNKRVTGFPVDGGEPRMVPIPDDWGFPTPDITADGDGLILQFRPMFNFGRGAGGGLAMNRGDASEDDEIRLPLVRYDAELSPVDTLWTTPEPPMDMVQLEIGGMALVTMMSREFHPEFLWDAFSDGGVVVSDTAAYVLNLVAADGTVERVIRRGPPPRTATEADREGVRQRLREESEEGVSIRIGGSGPDEDTRRQMLEQRLEKMTFADLIPRIVDLRVDPRDRIWVGVSETTPGEVERIDLYDRDGRLIGQLRDLPMPDVFLGPDRVGVLRRDELDVQQVVILAVHPGTEVATP